MVMPIGGAMTSAISVSFQFSQNSQANRPITEIVSRTSTVSTTVAAPDTPATSYATLESRLPELWSSKKRVGRRTRRENIAPRRSSTTLLDTQCRKYEELKVRMPRSTKMPTIAAA
jgi:hypothetical protein